MEVLNEMIQFYLPFILAGLILAVIVLFSLCIILFLKIFNGEFVKDSGVLYLKQKNFKIECLDKQSHEITIDGEKGPNMPLDISVLPKRLSIFGKF